MLAIFKKEISSFFASVMGCIVISSFLIITGLFLWVFKGDFNIPDAGFADLILFFDFAPWILLFFVPAITMRSFSEEIRNGTMELLLTKPLSCRQLVAGKYFGALALVFMALLPTLFYIYAVWQLGAPSGNIDTGSTMGSYLGLFLLASTFVSIGLFASSLSDNQVVTYISGVLMCFFCFYGFQAVGGLGWDIYFLEAFGLKAHFRSMSRGILDTRDLVYFFSIILLFVIFSEIKIRISFR